MLDLKNLDIKKFKSFKSLEEIEAVVNGCIPQDYQQRLTLSDLLRLDLLQYETGLKIITTQMHAIVRDNKLKFEISVAGYRAIADRTGKYGGNDDPLFNDKYTQFQMEEMKVQYPTTATVTVWKIIQGTRCPFTATANWSGYAAKKGNDVTFMWKNKPFLMLGKIAESLALRKAFPMEIGNIYTTEEMEHLDGNDKSSNIPLNTIPLKSLNESNPDSEKIQDVEKAINYATNKLGIEMSIALDIIEEHDYNRKLVMEAFNVEAYRVKEGDLQKIESLNGIGIESDTLVQNNHQVEVGI